MSIPTVGILDRPLMVTKWPCAAFYRRRCPSLVLEHGDTCAYCASRGWTVPKGLSLGAFPVKTNLDPQDIAIGDLLDLQPVPTVVVGNLFGLEKHIRGPLRTVWDLHIAQRIAAFGGDILAPLYHLVMKQDLIHICPALKWNPDVAKVALREAGPRVTRYAMFQMLELSLNCPDPLPCVAADGLFVEEVMEVDETTREKCREALDEAVLSHDPDAPDGCVCVYCHWMAFRQHTQWILQGELAYTSLEDADAILVESQKLLRPTDEDGCGPDPAYVRGQQQALRGETMAPGEWDKMLRSGVSHAREAQAQGQQGQQQEGPAPHDENQPTAAEALRDVAQRQYIQERRQYRQHCPRHQPDSFAQRLELFQGSQPGQQLPPPRPLTGFEQFLFQHPMHQQAEERDEQLEIHCHQCFMVYCWEHMQQLYEQYLQRQHEEYVYQSHYQHQHQHQHQYQHQHRRQDPLQWEPPRDAAVGPPAGAPGRWLRIPVRPAQNTSASNDQH